MLWSRHRKNNEQIDVKVPRIGFIFLKKLKLERQQYIFAVATCGGTLDRTLGFATRVSNGVCSRLYILKTKPADTETRKLRCKIYS
jgi:hypothetical protein